jgi:UDP-N-acetylglucosamine acyltransferase
MNCAVHSTAQIAGRVKLGSGVSVGAFTVIEDDVEIGDHCRIGTHAVIHRYVRVGRHNHIHPHAVLGGLPQDLGFDREQVTYVEIGDGNVFREGVTINRATKTSTRIGSNCYFMNNSHVAHDCTVGDHSIFATGVTLGGHVQVGERVFFGGGVMVHQFCRIGTLSMIRGTSGVSKDVIPYTLIGGFPVRHYRLNTVGLRRVGIEGERLKVLSHAFRRLRRREGLDDLPPTPELLYLREWLAAGSRRGIHGFVDLRGNAGD